MTVRAFFTEFISPHGSYLLFKVSAMPRTSFVILFCFD